MHGRAVREHLPRARLQGQGLYKAERFTEEKGAARPDLLILFISTVSHKMALSVIQEARRNSVPVARVHTSSSTALRSALIEHGATA